MDKYAIEILQLIFIKLPQSQIATCSLVCRSWYIATRDPLYRSIHFYSLDRVLAFINLSLTTPIDEKDSAIIRYIKSAPRGFLVRKMTFHIQIKESSTWLALQTMSPRVTSVDMIPENNHELYGVCQHRYRHPLALNWKELERLPVWHKDDYGLWRSLLSDQLIYLGLDLYFYDHLIVADSMEEMSSSSNSLGIHNNLVTKTLHLPPMQCLQELDLYASRQFYLIDERSFEFIHAACPNLRTFSLTSFQMHSITTASSSTYLPANLISLHLDQFCIHDLNSYTYLGHKYPNLKSLKVQEIRKGHHHHYIDASDHRSAIFSLITNHFTQLTELSADLYESLDNVLRPSHSESIWPYDELRQWLSGANQKKSSNIKKLHWSCLLPLDPLVDDDEKITASPELTMAADEFPTRFYFSHLTSLLMIIPSNASWQQVQQLWGKANTKTPLLPLLETLTIRHKTGHHLIYSNNATSFPRQKSFDFFALATACPNLARLEIENGLFVPKASRQRNILSSLHTLAISNCLISLEKNVTDVCLSCPNLKRLSLNHVQCHLPSPLTTASRNDYVFVPTKESCYSFILCINLPFHSLDHLGLSSLWYERMMASDHRYTKRVAFNQIRVNQASMENQNSKHCHSINNNCAMTKASILVNCKYVAQSNINIGKYR